MLEQPSANENQVALEAALASFDQPAVVGKVSSPMKADLMGAELTAEQDPDAVETEDVNPEVEETEEEEEVTSFASQFEETFGMKPDEAVSMFESLSKFRDEMSLMREWNIPAGEYDSRMGTIKEFYNTLPEDKRETFNSLEGAKAIWKHISENQAKAPASKKATTRSGSFAKAPAPKQDFIKRSDILAMDDKTYQANYRRITLAYAQGKVIED